METIILACLTSLVLLCMIGAGWLIWMLLKSLQAERANHEELVERTVARFTETVSELTTKVKATTLEEATRYNALMHEIRKPPARHARAHEVPMSITPEMAEAMSKDPRLQQMMMETEA